MKTAILILLCITMLVGCDMVFDIPHPSDDKLIKNFQKHESDFNKLISMSNEDSKVIRIADDFTRLENNWSWPRPDSEIGFSTQRWNEYRSIFIKLGLDEGIERDQVSDKTAIFLIASAKGIVNRGSSKGYAYSEKELLPLFDSLDQNPIKREDRQRHGTLYKRIKDYWYIYYEW